MNCMNIYFSENKQNKSDSRGPAIKFLASRIGNQTSVIKSGALCAGQYNSTQAVNVRIRQL